MDEAEEETTDFIRMKRKIDFYGVNIDSCTPGLYDLLLCPKCKGGRSMQRSLSFHVSENWNFAMWRCFDVQCGWAGKVFADTKKPYLDTNLHGKFTSSWPLSEESLRLEALGDELCCDICVYVIEVLQCGPAFGINVGGGALPVPLQM